MDLPRLRTVLLVLFVPTSGTVLALLGSWGAQHQAVATPIIAVVQLAYVAVLWRISEPRLRTTFVAAVILSILGESISLAVLRLFRFEVGGLPVSIVLLHAMLVWACITLVGKIGADLRLNRIGQVVALAAVLGAAAIAFILHDFQQLVLFGLFPVAYFLVRRPEQRLAVGIAFFTGLALEMGGTLLGAWEWFPNVLSLPQLGRGFTNPPYGSGALYALAVALILLLSPLMEPALTVREPPTPRFRGRSRPPAPTRDPLLH